MRFADESPKVDISSTPVEAEVEPCRYVVNGLISRFSMT